MEGQINRRQTDNSKSRGAKKAQSARSVYGKRNSLTSERFEGEKKNLPNLKLDGKFYTPNKKLKSLKKLLKAKSDLLDPKLRGASLKVTSIKTSEKKQPNHFVEEMPKQAIALMEYDIIQRYSANVKEISLMSAGELKVVYAFAKLNSEDQNKKLIELQNLAYGKLSL